MTPREEMVWAAAFAIACADPDKKCPAVAADAAVKRIPEHATEGAQEHKIRQDEKPEWLEKIRTKKFWLALIMGVEGLEGEQCATDVYNILRDFLVV